jgi:YD repeat-containing protein
MLHPETGTTTFTYNADFTLATKVDAKNQKIAFTYDTYKRVTEIAKHPVSTGAEDACQHVTFKYDTNPYDGAYSSNISGRLAAVRWGGTGTCNASQGGQWTEMYSYSSAGLPTKKRLDLTRGVNTVTMDTSNTYNNEGQLTNFTYPLNTNNYQHGLTVWGGCCR